MMAIDNTHAQKVAEQKLTRKKNRKTAVGLGLVGLGTVVALWRGLGRHIVKEKTPSRQNITQLAADIGGRPPPLPIVEKQTTPRRQEIGKLELARDELAQLTNGSKGLARLPIGSNGQTDVLSTATGSTQAMKNKSFIYDNEFWEWFQSISPEQRNEFLFGKACNMERKVLIELGKEWKILAELDAMEKAYPGGQTILNNIRTEQRIPRAKKPVLRTTKTF